MMDQQEAAYARKVRKAKKVRGERTANEGWEFLVWRDFP